MIRISILLLALTLAACGPSREQIAASQDAQCQSYGAEPGTEQYYQCRMSLNQNAVAAEMQRRENLSRALSNVQFKPVVQRPPIVCQTTPSGFGTQTTCQ